MVAIRQYLDCIIGISSGIRRKSEGIGAGVLDARYRF